MSDPSDNAPVLVALARVEGKIDLTLAETAALKAADADKEARLRAIESQPAPDPVTESRIRALEDRATISPKHLWLALTGFTGLFLAIVSSINQVKGFLG